jgi:DNA repair exonuclease SbcCD ATPase subunit
MFIKNVYMKNFGNVQEQRLDFTEGLTLFSGNNGEGKSTILRCLTLLLFNQTTGKLSDYIRWGTDGFEISTELTHKGQDLKISFSYSEKSSNREVSVLNTSDKYQNSAALVYLDELFDSKRALSSIVSFENEIDLITTSPSERREYLKRIYDLNFKNELNQIISEKNSSEKEVQKLSGEISALESMTFERLMPDRLPFSKEVYDQKLSNLESVQSLISSLKRQKEDEESNKKKVETLEYDIYKLDKKIETQKENISNSEKQIIDTKKKDSEIVLDIPAIEEVFNEEKENLLSDKEVLKSKIDSLKSKLSNLEEPSLDLESLDVSGTREEVYNFQYQINDLEKQIKTFESGKCPTCGHEVDKSFLDNSTKRLENLRDLWTNKKKELEEKEELRSSYQESLKDYEKRKRELESQIKDSISTLASIEKDCLHIEEKKQSKINLEKANFEHLKSVNQQKIKEEENKIVSYNEVMNSSIEDRDRLSEDLQSLQEKLSSLSNITTQLEEQNSLEVSLRTDIKMYDGVVSSNEEKKKLNEIQSKKEDERDESLVEKKKELLHSQEDVSLAEFSYKILSKEFPSFVISRMISSLTFYVNEFLSKVYPNYNIEIVESKNSLRVLYGPNRSDVKLASGFEQQIFSFAWKYALGKIQNYGILILDEVDSAASDENSEKFYSTLAKMDNCFKQIFVVTHKQEIKDLLANDYDASIYEVTKGNYEKVV